MPISLFFGGESRLSRVKTMASSGLAIEMIIAFGAVLLDALGDLDG